MFGDKKKQAKAFIQRAVALACVDGHIDESEMHAIAKLAIGCGLDASDLERIVQNPSSVKPVRLNRADALTEMMLLLSVAAADGVLDDSELGLLGTFGAPFGVTPDDIAQMMVRVAAGESPTRIVASLL